MQSLGELIDWCEEHRRRGRDTAHESVELAFDERLLSRHQRREELTQRRRDSSAPRREQLVDAFR